MLKELEQSYRAKDEPRSFRSDNGMASRFLDLEESSQYDVDCGSILTIRSI